MNSQIDLRWMGRIMPNIPRAPRRRSLRRFLPRYTSKRRVH